MIKSIVVALLATASIVFTSCGGGDSKLNESDVPQAVVQSFQAKYPTATDVKWKTETHNNKKVYEAEFKTDGKEVEAEFDEAGTFIREEE